MVAVIRKDWDFKALLALPYLSSIYNTSVCPGRLSEQADTSFGKKGGSLSRAEGSPYLGE